MLYNSSLFNRRPDTHTHTETKSVVFVRVDCNMLMLALSMVIVVRRASRSLTPNKTAVL